MIDPKKPVSIESLLHLKRSERPPESFWEQFDSELRAKQLAAIVARRPWWSGFSTVAAVRMVPLTAGALAIAAVAGLTVHRFSAHPQVTAPAAPVMRASAMVATTAPTPAVSSSAAADAESVSIHLSGPAAVASVQTPVPSAQLPERASDHRASVVIASAGISRAAHYQSVPVIEVSAPADSMSFAMDASGMGMTQPASYVTSAAAVEPLARTMGPSDERRAAMLNDPFPATTATWHSSTVASDDRVAHDLSDERLYQAVRRLSAAGNHLMIRF